MYMDIENKVNIKKLLCYNIVNSSKCVYKGKCMFAHNLSEQKKEYYAENNEKILEQRKQYYAENKEKKKQYYIDNIEKILEQKKQYRLENSDKINERARIKYAEKKLLKDLSTITI